MPGGFGQFAGNEFLQGPMANVAVGYGAAVASQGKEYMEKHVCEYELFSYKCCLSYKSCDSFE